MAESLQSLNHEKFMDKLRYVVDATSCKVGNDYFKALAETLSKALDAEYVFVSEALEDFKRVRTLAFWNNDHFGDNIEYDTKDTPCEFVLDKKISFYPEGVQQQFPSDDDLVKLGVQSYLAIPFFDADGQPFGHVCAMSKKPMEQNIYNEYLLEIISQRLTAEYIRKRSEQRLAHLANHDFLTQLPNRILFWDRLNTAISRGTRNNNKFGIIFIDLDNFKILNDKFGHQFGDDYLVAIARRLQEFCRRTDTLCRFGGDEFVVIVENANHVNDISGVAYGIHYALTSDDYVIDGTQVIAEVSIGFATFPEHASEAEALLKKADLAMYKAKHNQSHVEIAN